MTSASTQPNSGVRGLSARPLRPVRLGLLGCGVVGRGLIDLIERNHDLIAARSGLDLQVRRVWVMAAAEVTTSGDGGDAGGGSDAGDAGDVGLLPPERITTDPERVIAGGDIDTVVALVDDIDTAHRMVAAALQNGKDVVTANMALLAQCGQDLRDIARSQERAVGYEASVCAGVPVVAALRQGLVGNRIERLCGIVSTVTNSVLSRMSEQPGLTQSDAVAALRAEGQCGDDVSRELDGIDAAQKLVVLGDTAFGARVDYADVFVQGIRNIEPVDVAQAKLAGYAIRHLVSGRRVGATLDMRTQPMLLPHDHPLVAVRENANAVLVQGDAVGELLLQGRGGGALPTASALLADITAIAERQDGDGVFMPVMRSQPAAGGVEGEFYLRFPIPDSPGIVGHIGTALGAYNISIKQAHAELVPSARGEGNVMVWVHRCHEDVLRRALRDVAERSGLLRESPVVLAVFSGVVNSCQTCRQI